jgi:hypothetical protein
MEMESGNGMEENTKAREGVISATASDASSDNVTANWQH